MIYSMTAFARIENQQDEGHFVCEMRSINHRYLEISLYLPETFRMFEMSLREQIRKKIKRGKVECSVRYQPLVGNTGHIKINTDLAKELCKASEQIASFFTTATPSYATDILRFPGVLENKDNNEDQEHVLNEVVGQTLDELVVARAREGEALNQLFLERMTLIEVELAKVRERLPQIIKEQQERLLKRFSDVKLELDPGRLEQEMVLFAQRIDVAEEVERTQTHINEVRRVLKQGGLVGRRLDFLLQELNREANTLGSKSVDSVTTHAAVEMKVLIEQVREQVQNIE